MSYRTSPCMLTALSFLLSVGLAAPAATQTVRGLVVEQGTHAPVAGAVVNLLDESLERQSSTVTDEGGGFAFSDIPPGTYLAQAEFEGLHSAPSEALEVGSGTAAVEIVLTLPSPLVMLAGRCAEEEREPGTGVLVGVLWDGESDVPLPGGQVTLRWEEEGQERSQQASTDAGGRYSFCSVPVGVPITARVAAFGRHGAVTSFLVPASPLARQDLELAVALRGSIEVRHESRQGGAQAPGTLTGTLLDAETGQPIRGAAVSLVGTALQQITDAQGRFRFEGLTPRSYTLHVQHLGYGTQSESVELPGGTDVSATLRVAARAVEIEGISVRARSALERARRASPTAFRAIAGEDLRLLELQGATVADALRHRIPALRVMEGAFETADGPSAICIETNRRIMSIRPTGSSRPFCAMVAVFLDDIRIVAPGTFLAGLQVADFESIQFLSPLDAGVRYGLNAGNGVLLLYTRGRGPFADSARN